MKTEALKSVLPSYFPQLNFDFHSVRYPTCWNLDDKCSLLDVARNRHCVEYIGEGKNDSEAAAVRTDYEIPSQIGIFYFEVKIKSRGKDGFIGIGLSKNDVSLIRLPG
jgi:hypothetical protein